eukprot:Anaeramoba_flamelloidesa118785_80.p1 GENE.a118785_80~~a118785_80.p1  ORF type:complete len:212 (+),score=29.33 a118785_80:158-793(+)
MKGTRKSIMTEKEKKSTVHLIIETLMSGAPLRSKEITDIISDTSGKTVKVQDVASMLSRITDADKCELGYFIHKEREGNRFTYRVVDEFLNLSPKQAYGMTLKTGKERYPLDQALKDFPALGKYVDSRAGKKSAPAKTRRARAGKTPRAAVREKKAAPKKAVSLPDYTGGIGAEEIRAMGELLEKVKEIAMLKEFDVNVNVTFKIDGFWKK